jgi:hypothetical protein
LEAVSHSLASDGVLEATIRVPDTAGDVVLRADLRARKTQVEVTVQAPLEGKPATRVSWLLRALADARPDLLLRAHFPNARQPITATLQQVRDSRKQLDYPSDPKRPPRDFTVALVRQMGQKRGRGSGSFVSETRAQLFDFYRDIGQELRRWQAKPPRLPDVAPEDVPEAPTPDPPPFVAADTREVGSAIDAASRASSDGSS